ncbi:secreted protein [Beggiatoa sp. PS]|nr:secreted protein [Beggiatoa sp. PS]
MLRQIKNQKRWLQIMMGFLWILLYSQGPSYAETVPKSDWEITVDLSQPQQGTATVEMSFYQHPGEIIFFKK